MMRPFGASNVVNTNRIVPSFPSGQKRARSFGISSVTGPCASRSLRKIPFLPLAPFDA